ncbi:MAG TPA: ribose 5-phosphate isomerase B [Anaerolineales bacterium]|nr:ribose 5-phosphate isomerase B [Anaerolineales bacterium]
MSNHVNSQTRIAIGSDHVGLPLKAEIKKYLDEMGYAYQDFGAQSAERTDYPLFAKDVTSAISSGAADLGILICGTGVGMSITANKVNGIRAVVCSEPYSAMLSRQHNNTNVLALGARVIGPELARMIVKSWLEAEFEGGRHASRLEIISQIEGERETGQTAVPQNGNRAHHDSLSQTRKQIAETGKLVFERHLTDAAGGNISVRVDDTICITPRYSGSKRHWQLQPNQVLVSDMLGNKLEGDGDVSRESKVHYRIYQEFPDAKAVLHSHARNAMVFVASGQPIEPVLEATLKFDTIPVTKFAPAHSEKLADAIVEMVRGKEEYIRKYATAVLAPWHGLFVIGKDLDAAFDLTERIDTNAYCILMSRLLPEGGPMDPETMRMKLSEAIRTFNDHHANA